MPEATAAQKFYYYTILVPLWRNELEGMTAAAEDYRRHLLAIACLKEARGPGGDPLELANFCRTWGGALSIPIVGRTAFGPTAWLRRLGKWAAGAGSLAAMFDLTQALTLGVRIIGQMGPLVGKTQMRDAQLLALDQNWVAGRDQSAVLAILADAGTPSRLLDKLSKSKQLLEAKEIEVTRFAEKMRAAGLEMGLTEDALSIIGDGG